VGTCWSVRPLLEDSDHLTVEIVEELPTLGGVAFCVEEFVTMTQKIGGTLAGETPSLQRVELAYPAPPHAVLYPEICQCPVRFSAPRTEITLSRRWVDKALRSSDREFNDICLQNCSQIMRQIAQESPLLSRLRILLLRSPSAVPSLEAAAVALGVSSRTLRRQLHDLDHSYHKLVADFRTELACEYLRSSSLSAKEIGYLLGFVGSNAFRRAFKTWTGSTVSDYRRARQVESLSPDDSDP
jgi:AraC-like DNA-binding protein